MDSSHDTGRVQEYGRRQGDQRIELTHLTPIVKHNREGDSQLFDEPDDVLLALLIGEIDSHNLEGAPSRPPGGDQVRKLRSARLAYWRDTYVSKAAG
jgi:hypothetical protein